MKKNYMMRLAAVLLVLVLLSTCVISGTFAKYTTDGTATDSAKVAKWGVEIAVTTVDTTEYDGKATSGSQDTGVLAGTTKLLAPGTSINFGEIEVTGQPEVAVKVEYVATLTFSNTWTADYMPLVFVVDGVEITATTVADMITKLEKAIEDKTNEYAPNTDLANTLTVSCYWAFAGDDAKDTVLGNAEPTVSLTIECTVSQIDTYPSI